MEANSPSRDESVIETPSRMVGVAYHVASSLQDLHGVKSVVQSKDDYTLRVTAHDDYPVLSHIQTVCAWNQATFTVESAGRVDGDIVVRIHVSE